MTFPSCSLVTANHCSPISATLSEGWKDWEARDLVAAQMIPDEGRVLILIYGWKYLSIFESRGKEFSRKEMCKLQGRHRRKESRAEGNGFPVSISSLLVDSYFLIALHFYTKYER